MKSHHFFLSCATVLLLGTPPLAAKTKPAKEPAKEKKPEVYQDDAVRMQLFLDASNFGPGKIDGNYGGFTRKSWQYYQRAQGETSPKDTFDVKAAPLASSEPLYTTYTITPADVGSVAPLSSKLAEQAKGKAMPYSTLGEFLGERYHSEVKFLAHLNPGKNLDRLKEGDQVTVPNVAKPFDLAEVAAKRQAIRDAVQKAKQEAEEKKKDAARNDKDNKGKNKPGGPAAMPDGSNQPTGSPEPSAAARPPIDLSKMMVHVSVKEAYLEVHDGDKIVAGFPITPGSSSIPSPKGEWKIESKTLLPEFRWDKAMLLRGERSSEFYQLPPGPNNPVGIAWIALNKRGIGLHGTNEPETIGRAASHGCIRLANWDAFKLFDMVEKGEKVVIE